MKLEGSDDTKKIQKVLLSKHQTVIYSSEYGSPRNNNQVSKSNDMQINENDIIDYLKNHFDQIEVEKKTKINSKSKKSLKREAKKVDISSLPCSDSDSQNRHIFSLNDFHDDRRPNCLSSVGDLSPRDEELDKNNSHFNTNLQLK